MSKLLLPAVSLTISKAFRCISYPEDGVYVLLADQSLSCDSAEYGRLWAYAVFCGLFFPVGIPIAWLVCLRQLRSRIDPPMDEDGVKHEVNMEGDGG